MAQAASDAAAQPSADALASPADHPSQHTENWETAQAASDVAAQPSADALASAAGSDEPVAVRTATKKKGFVKKHFMHLKRRMGMSSKPTSKWRPVQTDEHRMTVVERFPKTQAEKQLLMDAFKTNKFMQNYTENQIDNFTNGMDKVLYKAGDVIIRQGDTGSVMYIVTFGEVDVSTVQQGNICNLAPGSLFGELAIIHDAKRTATITVWSKGPCTCWSLQGSTFKNIIKATVESRIFACKTFPRNSSLFAQATEESLTRMGKIVRDMSYKKGDYIIRQGYVGMSFYLLVKGTVRITKNMPAGVEKRICELGIGGTFGELALTETFTDGRRQANVIAMDDVVCMQLGKDGYHCMLREMNLHSESSDWARVNLSELLLAGPEKPPFEDLSRVDLVGLGSFGWVDLVAHGDKTFALKCIAKDRIVFAGQQEHILNERRVMLRARSPFIVRMYATYRDTSYVYMLLEACLGGDLLACANRRGCHFDAPLAQFIVGSVVEALAYLHGGCIAYRDLKAENIVIDNLGRVKLTDFGFARYIAVGGRSWTLCGTNEFLAPEMILGIGHSLAVDYWGLGHLIYFLMAGKYLFGSAAGNGSSYPRILEGVAAVDFDDLDARCTNIVQELCSAKELGRLGSRADGIDGIRNHMWFTNLEFDWGKLQDQSMKSPLVPHLESANDTSQFDKPVLQSRVPKVDLTEWDYEFDRTKKFNDAADYVALDAKCDEAFGTNKTDD